MRQDGREVGYGREDDEGAYEGVERRRGSNVDARQQGRDATTDERRIERVLPFCADLADEVGERRGSVARERPQHAPGRDVGSDQSAERGEPDDDDEAGRASGRVGRLPVEFRKRRRVRLSEDSLEVVDGVEDGDEIKYRC